MRAIPLLAVLALCACAGTPQADAQGVLAFAGTVSAVRKDCYFDAVCSATVDGIVVTTMTGERLGNPVWGQPNNLPQVGDRVQVRCLKTGPSSCTLKGDTGYFIRPAR